MELHIASAGDNLHHTLSAFSVQSWHLFFDSWQDHIPELRFFWELVKGNEFETVANLEVGKMLRVMFENKGDIGDIFAALKGAVDLVENVIWHVMEIIIASGMNLALLESNKGDLIELLLSLRILHNGEHRSSLHSHQRLCSIHHVSQHFFLDYLFI